MGENGNMSTVFELIIRGDIPGRFIWADDVCVAILTIEPVSAGHALVIPREPVSKWTDLQPSVLDHVMRVAQIIGQAQEQAFGVPRTAVVIAGFEVPHTHVHVIPAKNEEAISLANARPAQPRELDEAGHALRDALRRLGHTAHLPMRMESPDTF